MPIRDATTRSYSWDDSFLRRDDGRPISISTTSLIAAGVMGVGAPPDGISTDSSSSISPPEQQQLQQQRKLQEQPVLLRTNFGKNSVYRPPTVAGWNPHPTHPSTTAATAAPVTSNHNNGSRGGGPQLQLMSSPSAATTRDVGYNNNTNNNSEVVSQAEDSDVPFDQQPQRGEKTKRGGEKTKKQQQRDKVKEKTSRRQPDSRPYLPDLSSRPRKFRPTSSLSPTRSRNRSLTVVSLASPDRPFDERTQATVHSHSEPESTASASQPPALKMSLATERRRADMITSPTTKSKKNSRRGDKRDLRNPDESPDDHDSGAGRRDTAFADDDDQVDDEGILAPRDRTYHDHSDSNAMDKNGNDMMDDEQHQEEQSIQRRYRMVPPRISDPMLIPYESMTTRGGGEASTTDTYTSPDDTTGLTIISATDALRNHYDPNPHAAYSSRGQRQQQVGGKNYQSNNNNGDNNNGRDQPENEDEDNDSIFDFEDVESRRRKAKKWRNSRRAASTYASTTTTTDDTDDYDEEDDDVMGVGGGGGVGNTLTERAQAAWKRKQQRAARSKEELSPRGSRGGGAPSHPRSSSSSSRPKQEPDSPGPAVHFSQNKDTVHHFTPDQGFDNLTLGGRSLNSEYTKSAESEVEDFIKDLLMIGSGKGNNPGRRKVKYNSQVKRKLKQKGGQEPQPHRIRQVSSTMDDDVDEELTLETFEEDISGDPFTLAKNNGRRDSTGVFCAAHDTKDDDPLSSVWNYIEGGFNAVSSVLGFDDGSSTIDRNHRHQRDNPHAAQPGSESSRPSFARPAIASSAHNKPRTKSSSSPSPRGDCDCDSVSSSPDGFFDHVMEETEAPGMNGRLSRYRDNGRVIMSAPSLEDDGRLVDLAVQAARSLHKLRGFEYDESNEINITKDVKFSVVDLRLPLGLIFQENETGCWVTKVMPDGSAYESQCVDVGDQLAAIDGLSAIHMNVDQIAGLIRQKDSDIELTFLRYVGPWCPAEGTVAEEGYEVKMQSRVETPPRMALGRCGALVAGGSNNNNNNGSSSKTFSSSKLLAGSSSKPLSNSKLGAEYAARPSKAVSNFRLPVAAENAARPTSTPNRNAMPDAKDKKRFRLFGRKK